MYSKSRQESVGIYSSKDLSAQGLGNGISSPSMKIPLPPRLWITDIEDETSDHSDDSDNEDGGYTMERARIRSRFRHYKQRSLLTVPIGIFWDIENCQVPRGCSAIDVVSAIRAKFLTTRREADFVVVCDVRKESTNRLQELNDAQVSLIHVCGTQKNAADEKLRQCMRRFGELHSAPGALLLISGDINFAADLSDFRHRKNMEVILVHKQNTSSALIACATSHYCYNELTANLPRNPKTLSQTEDDEEPTSCEMEVANLPMDQPAERVSRRLRRLADNCGGKVLRVTASTAVIRFATPDHASRALKRMDGEDVFGRKISTRYARSVLQPAYSSDEGYGTATATVAPPPRPVVTAPVKVCPPLALEPGPESVSGAGAMWALALRQLPAPTPPPLEFCPPPAPRLRKIRGTHGSNLDRSACSSSNSGDDSRRELSLGHSRAASPWNGSNSFSEHSEQDDGADLTVTNLPSFDPVVLQEMLTQLFSQYVPVVRVSVWAAADGPLATVSLRSEWDARVAIARVHKRRLDSHWTGRRLELALGRPTPAPNLDVLRTRLKAILLEQKNFSLPLLRLRDAYASRHCCALTTSDLAKVKDTVVIHDGFGRMVQLIDTTPVFHELEEAPWKCHAHTSLSTNHEDGSRILKPVYMEISVLSKHVALMLESHGGIVPLLSFVECYEAMFAPLTIDACRGVPLELLLRRSAAAELRERPSRHLTWRQRPATPPEQDLQSESSRSSGPRTAPALEPMLALFERELLDLLRSARRCCIAFSKLIPAFHHHFGRQCRVADYGFTKLPDLLAALSSSIVVIGSGSSRVITMSAAAQSRRWTSDLVKLLKAQPGRSVAPQDIPHLYMATFNRQFSPVDYGVCLMSELLAMVAPQSVIVGADGTLSLPRPSPTQEEKSRTIQFAVQAVELLCYTPNLCMEFSRFVPAYHAHFDRQLRVAHYGCVKLVELFELIPEAVSVGGAPGGERVVRLADKPAKAIMAQRITTLAPIALSALGAAYAVQYGGAPQGILGTTSLEALVFACGGCVENGIVCPPGSNPSWAVACLSAAAVLANDKRVARGSTQEYFTSAYRRLYGADPSIDKLQWTGVIEVCQRQVSLTDTWRGVWRAACILGDSAPMLPQEILDEYNRRYDASFSADMGPDGVCDFLRMHRSVFNTERGRWALSAGVALPRVRDLPPRVDYSLYDTPPGQKGSRVFDSPNSNIWCSPPASALPTPTALISHDTKRRGTRLAAQFDAA